MNKLRGNDLLVAPADASAATRAVVTTWNAYGGLLAREAERLSIPVAVAVAVLLVEAGGEGYGPNGLVKLRFENHIFAQTAWASRNREKIDQHFAYSANQGWQGHQWRADPNGPWLDCHQSQAGEWAVFEFAQSLDPEAAARSSSMGAAQIMGFNHAVVGYASAQEMLAAFQADIGNQLLALFKFIEANRPVEAIRTGDYLSFANSYNGSGQAAAYAKLITEYVIAFQELLLS